MAAWLEENELFTVDDDEDWRRIFKQRKMKEEDGVLCAQIVDRKSWVIDKYLNVIMNLIIESISVCQLNWKKNIFEKKWRSFISHSFHILHTPYVLIESIIARQKPI